MDERVRDLRRRLGGLRRSGRRGRREYPVALRDEVQAYIAGRRASGASVDQIAGELGLPASTVNVWSTRGPAGGAFRPVVVAEAPPAKPTTGALLSRAGAAELVLLTPSGYRVEGLQVAELVSLLQALA